MQSLDELLNCLGAQQRPFRRVCFARAAMHIFLIGFMRLRRPCSQPALPIAQQVGGRLEKIRLHMLDGLDSPAIRKTHKDLLNQIFDLTVPANPLFEKTHQWSAKPPRQGFEDLVAVG